MLPLPLWQGELAAKPAEDLPVQALLLEVILEAALGNVLPAAERALLYAHAGEAGEDDFGGEFEGGDER